MLVLAAATRAHSQGWERWTVSTCLGRQKALLTDWLWFVLCKTSQVDWEITSGVLLLQGRLVCPMCLLMGSLPSTLYAQEGSVLTWFRDFLTFKCSVLALKPCGQVRHPGLRTVFCDAGDGTEDTGPSGGKPSPNNSGQATKQKARWAEKKGRGSCDTLKNHY